MEKFCLFCGERPESKNREHVIPMWLLRMTGDPNRKAYLGLKWMSPTLEKREYSFSSFTFPACASCNSEFSALEGMAKGVVEDILNRRAVSFLQWNAFLDWLDKIRIGLWLGMIYLNENQHGLIPKFHIGKRVGTKDRMLIVYEIADEKQGISWTGTESPLFGHAPICFTFCINNFLFLNASADFFLAQRCGFPFPRVLNWLESGLMKVDMEAGTNSLAFPIVEKRFKAGGTQLFQPMIPYVHIKGEDTERFCADLYDNDYVRARCADFKSGRGFIYRRDRNSLSQYPDAPSSVWLPKQKFPRGDVVHQVGVEAGEFLEQLLKASPSFETLPSPMRERNEAEIASAHKLHKLMMSHFISQKDMMRRTLG